MPQTNVIFAFLFAAYFVFITVRGELPIYLGFIFASPKTAAVPVKADTGLDVSKAASVAETALTFLA